MFIGTAVITDIEYTVTAKFIMRKLYRQNIRKHDHKLFMNEHCQNITRVEGGNKYQSNEPKCEWLIYVTVGYSKFSFVRGHKDPH